MVLSWMSQFGPWGAKASKRSPTFISPGDCSVNRQLSASNASSVAALNGLPPASQTTFQPRYRCESFHSSGNPSCSKVFSSRTFVTRPAARPVTSPRLQLRTRLSCTRTFSAGSVTTIPVTSGSTVPRTYA